MGRSDAELAGTRDRSQPSLGGAALYQEFRRSITRTIIKDEDVAFLGQGQYGVQ
jgi:hypothetical protein